MTIYSDFLLFKNIVSDFDVSDFNLSCNSSRSSYDEQVLKSSVQRTDRLVLLCGQHHSLSIYTVSRKNCAKLFLSELCQIFTNFDNFWQKDGKEAKIMRDGLISTSPNSRQHSTVLNADVPNCYTTLKVVICNELSNN